MSDLDTITYKSIIDRLQSDENKQNALNDMKNLLEYKPKPVAATTIKTTGISKIVNCLNVPDGIQTNLACEVLKICFEKFDPGEVIKMYTSNIMYLLRHYKCCVRKLAVDEVHRAVNENISLLPVPEYIDVFVAVAQLVCDEDVGVASKAIVVTSNLPHEAYEKVLDEMKIALQLNKSSRCNAFEVIINISIKDFKLFEVCLEQGYIDRMVTELDSDDVLYRMNVLDLLSQLAVKPHGIAHFVKCGVLKRITDFLSNVQSNPTQGLLVPGYMKFAFTIAHHYPKLIFEKYHELVDYLFEVLDSEDVTLLLVALDSLGFIGSTAEGKMCLAAQGGKYIQALEKLGNLDKSCTSEIKVRVLRTFADLIGVEKDLESCSKSPNQQRINLMTREWFRCLSKQPEPMDKLLALCKSPFPDIKSAALTLLDSVCHHSWGEELVAGVAGFIEYLLDRSVDDSKELKEAKYNIIKRLSRSNVFDDNIRERLQTYVEQGPFFSETQLQVAMEEGI